MTRSLTFLSFFKSRIDGGSKSIRSIVLLSVIGVILLISMGILFLQFTYNDISSLFGAKLPLFRDGNTPKQTKPLSLQDIHSYDRSLPQHNLSLPFPEGKEGRFVRFSNEIWALGLNNQLHNRLLLSHLAFLSNRAYVFNDITFDHDWNTAKWAPLNMFISGPTAGGSFPPILTTAHIPRAVHMSFYQTVCSENDDDGKQNDYAKLQGEEVNTELGITNHDEGIDIMEKWAKKLREMPERCVEIVGGSPHIFDFPLFSSKRILSLYPSIATSPVITQFHWSDVVLHAVERISPSISHPDRSSRAVVKYDSDRQHHDLSSNPLLSTLAVHVRRGDFSDHCYGLANMGYPYNSWNLLPGLLDRYDEPNYEKIYDDGTDARRAKLDRFLEHCWPSAEQIVHRVKEVTKEYYESRSENDSELSSVYILTNERDGTWLSELKNSLMGIRVEDILPSTHSDQYFFRHVATSRDMLLTSEAELLTKQAIDMAIAERAGLFLGNGFSTLSANVNLFRLARGLKSNTCRLF